MMLRTFQGTIDGIEFDVMMIDSRPWSGLDLLNPEQQEDVLAVVLEVIAEQRAAWIAADEVRIAEYMAKVREIDSIPIPAHYVACNDCHHMIDPADDAHMCVEREYRLRTAPRTMTA